MLEKSILDITNEDEVVELEKAVYDAFYRKEKNPVALMVAELIGEDRMRFNIPYRDQIVFLFKSNGKIFSGLAINTNIEKMQCEELGFQIDKSPEICEALYFFILENKELHPIKHFVDIKIFSDNNLKSLGYYKAFSNCSDKVLKTYTRFGFKPIGEKMVLGIKKYLLEYDIK
jgi:hypothetical protein